MRTGHRPDVVRTADPTKPAIRPYAAEAIMGIDVRDMPDAAAVSLPDRLREAGFDVDVSRSPHPQLPALVVTRILCRRGKDVQTLESRPSGGKPGERRVYIANARGWRRSVRLRRCQLQEDVTSIIEQNGGHWPFPG